MNNKVKKIVIYLIAIIIIIIFIILIYMATKKKSDNYYEERGENFIETYGKSDDSGNIDRQAYFDIQSCISKYLNTININNDMYYSYDNNGKKVQLLNEGSINSQIYNLLSEQFIKENSITVDNLRDKIKVLNTSVLFVPLELSMAKDGNIKTFIAHGILETFEYKQVDEIFIVVNIDATNSRFSITPIDGKYSNISEINNIKTESKIDKKEDNSFNKSNPNYENIIKDYINIYKRLSLGNPSLMYKFMDKEYREKRFKNLSNFKKYTEENKENIIAITPESYEVVKEDGYTEYRCFDKNEFYYVIKEKSIGDFSISMDKHTIDTNEFIKKYNESDGKIKVGLNIYKIVDALNMKDYGYVYSKLSDGFKKNYFKTEEDFVKFAKIYFKNNNKVKFNEYSSKSDSYVYNITLTDKTGKSTMELNTDILMRLGEGTDFVFTMSGVVPEIIYSGF